MLDPSGGGRHRDVEAAVQVVTAAREDWVVENQHLEVEVAGVSSAETDLTLTGQLDTRSGVYPGWDLDRQ